MLSIKRAIVDKISTMSDRGLKIVLITPELPQQEMIALFMAKAEGTESVRIEEPETDDLKSPGQRLRGVLYRVWETSSREQDFNTFYSSKMEQIISHYKEKLP